MIKLKNGERLYHITNSGCDDDTFGLAIIKDEHFPAFAEIIRNLNKNSTYSCMPTITVCEIKPEFLCEATDSSALGSRMYLGDKQYIVKDYSSWWKFRETVEVIA
jgi:hypothetical protein